MRSPPPLLVPRPAADSARRPPCAAARPPCAARPTASAPRPRQPRPRAPARLRPVDDQGVGAVTTTPTPWSRT